MKATKIALPAVLASSILLAGCTSPLATLQSKIPFLNKTGAPQGKLEQVAEAGKLSMMMATGKSGKCTVTDKKNNSTIEYYIKGKKMKFSGTGMGGTTAMYAESDSENPSPKQTKSYFLNDTEYTYMWEEGAESGLKTKLPSEEDTKKMMDYGKDTMEDAAIPETEASNPEISKFETDVNYEVNCDVIELNDSEFVPPANVKFVDFSAMNQEEMMKYGEQQGQTAPGSVGGSGAGEEKKYQGKSMEKDLPDDIKLLMESAPESSEGE